MTGNEIHSGPSYDQQQQQQQQGTGGPGAGASSMIGATNYYLVLLNGLILGIHTHPHQLVRNLRTMRRQGLTNEFVSVYLHDEQRAVHIATDGGRVCRPLIIVDEETQEPKLQQYHLEALALGTMTIHDLLKTGDRGIR